MEGYEDDLDEYAGYDEYDDYDEEGGEDQEEGGENEEEEERQPTREELEYLELRQRLKDSIRRKMNKKEGRGALANSQEKKNKLPYNDFGSFFGPSQPVISSRVIQESKSLLENEQLASRLLNSSQTRKKPVSAGSHAPRSGDYKQQSRVVNEVKKKVEKIKNTRDYSFLFSDDTDLPTSSKEQPSQRCPTPSFEARSAQLQAKPKQPSGINGRSAHSARDEKRPVSVNGQLPSRLSSSGGQVPSRPASGGQVLSRPALGGQMRSTLPSSGSQMQSRAFSSGGQMQSRPASFGGQMHPRPGSSANGQMHSKMGSSKSGRLHLKPGSSTNGQMHPRPGSSANVEMHQSASRNGQPNSRLSSQKPASTRSPDSASLNHKKQIGSNNGVGPGRPAGIAKALPVKAPVSAMERKASTSGSKNPLHSAQRLPSSSKALSSDPRQRVEQRKVSHEPTRSQMIPKQPVASAKHQISKPVRPAPAQCALDDRRLKKKPARMSEDDMALSMIRKMFNTDRYASRGYDDDDSDMEANFDEIMMEEKRSAKIAQKEDEEQLRLIEEEERREQMRKEAKKRKLSHR